MQAQEERTLWVPPSVQQDQPARSDKPGKPDQPNVQEKLADFFNRAKPNKSGKPDKSEKSKSSGKSTRHLSLPKFKAHPFASFKGKTLWDWMPILMFLLGILVVSGSILFGISRFTTQVNTTQTQLTKQMIQEQDKLAQQTIQQQTKLAKQYFLQQTKLATQYTSLVDQGHEQILTDYLNNMAAFAASPNQSNQSSQVILAQARTNNVLAALKSDARREAAVAQFLHDMGLTVAHSPNKPVITLTNTTLDASNFKQANLASANFDGASMTGAIFTNATLTSTSFRGTILTRANFTGANLQNADLSGANLQNAILTGANLKGANVSGADMKNAKITGIIW